jgi:hypothetical protein
MSPETYPDRMVATEVRAPEHERIVAPLIV